MMAGQAGPGARDRRPWIPLLLLVLVMPLAGCLYSGSTGTYPMDVTDRFTTLHQTLEQRIDRDGMEADIDIGAILAVDSTPAFESPPVTSGLFGYRDLLWYRTTLRPDMLGGQPAVLELPYALFAYVDAWVVTAGQGSEGGGQIQRYRSGMSRPFEVRTLAARTQAFPIPAATTDVEVLIRIVSGAPMHFGARLWSEPAWQRNQLYTNVWYGVLLGGIAILLLYNLFLAFALRDAGYVYYILYLSAMAMLIVDISGIRHELLPIRELSLVYLSAAAVFGMAFCISFLGLRRLNPWFARVGIFIASFALFAGIHYLIVVFGGVVLISGSFSLLGPLTASGLASIYYFLAPLYAYRRGVREARFLILAFGVIAVGFYWHTLRLFGLADPGFAIHHIIEVSVLAEAVLLALALADRINLLSAAKEAAERSMKQTQRYFSRRILELQEEERQQFANTLHDAIGHGLLVLKQRLDALPGRMAQSPDQQQEINLLRGQCADLMDEVRGLSHDLHPHILERLGLRIALENMLERAFTDTGVDWLLQMSLEEGELGKEQRIGIYRMVQEAINNVLKHARASEVLVRIRREQNAAVVEIKDDGQGVENGDSAERGIGLTTMRGRAELLGGWFQFESVPGEGSRVRFGVPVP